MRGFFFNLRLAVLGFDSHDFFRKATLKAVVQFSNLWFWWVNDWPSPPGTFHILIGKFPYFIIRFYYRAMKWKSDKLIGKFWNRKKSDYRRTRPMFGLILKNPQYVDPWIRVMSEMIFWAQDKYLINYSGVYKSWDEVFFTILRKP